MGVCYSALLVSLAPSGSRYNRVVINSTRTDIVAFYVPRYYRILPFHPECGHLTLSLVTASIPIDWCDANNCYIKHYYY